MFSSRGLSAVLALTACLLVVASGARMGGKSQPDGLSILIRGIADRFTADDRQRLYHLAKEYVNVANIFVPDTPATQLFLEGPTAEDWKTSERLGLLAFQRVDNTCRANQALLQNNLQLAMQLIPSEATVLLQKFFQSPEDFTTLKHTAFTVAEYLPRVAVEFFLRFDKSERQALKQLVAKYVDATTELVPAAKWALDIYNQMERKDFVALKMVAHNIDTLKSEDELLTILKRQSPLLHGKAVELRRAYNERVEALNAEARNHFRNVEDRVFAVASALRDSENLMNVYELALDSAIKSVSEFRALSQSALKSVAEQFPEEPRARQAFNLVFGKTAELVAYGKHLLETAH